MKSYAEKENIEQEVLDLIRHYISKVFSTYGNLKYKGIDRDDIESDVCFYIFKVNSKGETFLDKMSKIKTIKHLRAFVKRSVINKVNEKIRELESKPIFVELDYKMTKYYDANFEQCSGAEDNYNAIEDTNRNTEYEALLSAALNSIKIDKYPTYKFEYEPGKYKVLETTDLLWMIVHKKSVIAMTESVISKNTGTSIKRAILQKLILQERTKLMYALESNIDRYEMFK